MQLEFVQTEIDDEVGGGIQLLAEWHGCKLTRASLANTAALRNRCLAVVNEAGLTVCGDSFHTLAEGNGIIGVVLLAESHLAIRIWPDRAVVAIDVFVCNFTSNNRSKAQAVVESLRGTFKPDKENLIQVRRGGGSFHAPDDGGHFPRAVQSASSPRLASNGSTRASRPRNAR